MINHKYLKKIKDIIMSSLDEKTSKKIKIFIFGSSIINKKFNDIDIGLQNANITDKQVRELKENFTESDIPYKIDIINFDKADPEFTKKVFNTKLKWIT